MKRGPKKNTKTFLYEGIMSMDNIVRVNNSTFQDPRQTNTRHDKPQA